MRPERRQPARVSGARVDHAVVHSGGLGEMTGNEVAENSGIRRFGQVRRKSEEPAELATRRPEALARLIEKEEHQPRDDGGAPKPTQSGVVTRRYGVREQARCRPGDAGRPRGGPHPAAWLYLRI